MRGRLSVDDVGVAFCTTIFGGTASFLFCARSESLLLADGGGDLSLGLTGHEGVVASLGVFVLEPPRAGRAMRDAGSTAGAGCSCGAVAAESARWMAAAEGTLGL